MDKKYEKPALIFDQIYPDEIKDLIDDMETCTNEDGMMVLNLLLTKVYKAGLNDGLTFMNWLSK